MYYNRVALSLSFPLCSSINRYCLSQFRIRTALLQSRYHREGPPSFRIASNIKKILSGHLPVITNIQKELDTSRQVLLRRGEEISVKGGSQQQRYFKNYEKLVEEMDKCPLNNEWVYRLIGWYNLVAFYRSLVERLIEAKQDELMLLVKVLAQMTYTWDNQYGLMDQDLFKEQNISNFYKRLSKMQMDVVTLQQIESVLSTPVNFYKRNFYNNYFNKNIGQLLKYLQVEESYSLTHLCWLKYTYVHTMNDDEQGILLLQKYLLTNRPQLQTEDYRYLMHSYQLKGRINPVVYKTFIKPYITRHKMNKLQDLIDMVKFTVCSQSGDTSLLKALYELISTKYQQQQQKITSSRHTYTLHLYTHYLLCQGNRINLPSTLKKELTVFCRQRAEGRTNIHALLKMGRNKKTYMSPCLELTNRIIPQFQTTPTSVFETQFGKKLKQLSLKDYTVYQKPILCCFQLDYLLAHKGKNELIDVQIEGMQYVFSSGRLIREREIRDEILEHYGIRVNHLDYNMLKRSKFDENELLMMKGMGHRNN